MPRGYFTNREYWLKRTREGSKKLIKHVDINKLIERYVVDKVSTYKLQSEFNLDNTTLRNKLVAAGIKLRGAKEAQSLIPHPLRMSTERSDQLLHSPESIKKATLSRIGKKHSEQWKENMKKGIGRGKDNAGYRGNNIAYKSIHTWIRNNFLSKNVCEMCGKTSKTDWANKDGKYDREDRNNWMELCRSCHKKYDYKNGVRIPIEKYGKYGNSKLKHLAVD